MTGGSRLPSRWAWVVRVALLLVLVPLAAISPPRGGGEPWGSTTQRIVVGFAAGGAALGILYALERRRRR